jgi:predicted regulator of Ras-like GTPase activity (Roadblock/LC7/MglB family)
MAELFVKQGHPQRALAIYRKVVRDNPADEGARQRLHELEAGAASEKQGGPMNFREHIQHIVESTPGALACTIMGYDGIAIDSYEVGGGEVDIPTLLIEYAAAAQQLRRAAQEGSTGTFVEMAVATGKHSAVLRPLTEEYFLAVVLSQGAFVGKARFLMRLVSGDLARELS